MNHYSLRLHIFQTNIPDHARIKNRVCQTSRHLIGCMGLPCHSAWQQPLCPPSNPRLSPIIPSCFCAFKGLFCSIQSGCHGNATLTRAAAVKRLDLDF